MHPTNSYVKKKNGIKYIYNMCFSFCHSLPRSGYLWQVSYRFCPQGPPESTKNEISFAALCSDTLPVWYASIWMRSFMSTHVLTLFNVILITLILRIFCEISQVWNLSIKLSIKAMDNKCSFFTRKTTQHITVDRAKRKNRNNFQALIWGL